MWKNILLLTGLTGTLAVNEFEWISQFGRSEIKENIMLADIYNGRAVINRQKMDLHKHATFSCLMEKMMISIRKWFGS